LAVVVQGSQLVPVSRGLALHYHLLEDPDQHAENRSLTPPPLADALDRDF
jgi:hypothetical protein